MKQGGKAVLTNAINPIDNGSDQILMLGAMIFGLNIILMIFTILYWTNQTFHEYLVGSPL